MADRRSDEAPTSPSSTRTGKTKGAASESTEQTTDPHTRGAERFAAALAKTKDAAGVKSLKTRPTPAEGAKSATTRPGSARRVRRARLRLTHIDPWSVMKTAFLLSIAVGVVTIVAVGVVWSILGAAGVWDSIDSAVADVAGDPGTDFAIQDYLGTSRVLGVTMLLAVVDVFLLTVIATLGAFLYNLAAALLGGLEVVFAEEER